MPSGPKLSVLALVAVALLGWGLVALSPTHERPATRGLPEPPEPRVLPEPEPQAAPEPVAVAAPRPAPPKPPPAPVAATPPPATEPGPTPDPERPDFGDDPTDDPVARAYEEEVAKRDAHRARYDAASARFVEETRDAAWADGKEQEMQQIIDDNEIGDLVEGLECRATLCKLKLRFSSLTTSGAMLRFGPLAHSFGPDRAIRNEGPPDARVMVVYTSREGHELDAE